MAYKFPKKTTFDVPEGDYRAVVKDAFEMKNGAFRIVFSITSATHPLLNYVAGKNYPAGRDTVADDLINWLGLEQLQDIIQPDGTIDGGKLQGLSADIRIEHIHNDEYEKPFAFVSKIATAGKLTQDSSEKAA